MPSTKSELCTDFWNALKPPSKVVETDQTSQIYTRYSSTQSSDTAMGFCLGGGGGVMARADIDKCSNVSVPMVTFAGGAAFW